MRSKMSVTVALIGGQASVTAARRDAEKYLCRSPWSDWRLNSSSSINNRSDDLHGDIGCCFGPEATETTMKRFKEFAKELVLDASLPVIDRVMIVTADGRVDLY